MNHEKKLKDFIQLVRKMRDAQSSGYVRKGAIGIATGRMMQLEEMVDEATIKLSESLTRTQPVIDAND